MKKNLFFTLTLILIMCLFTSCGSTYMAVYDLGLSSVESPSDLKDPFGNSEIVKISDEVPSKNKKAQIVNKYRYTDKYIDIVWWYSTTQFEFELKNVSEKTLKINWDDVTFMDYTGNISRIMHKGVKYIDKDKSQGSISIPKNGKLNDIIVPTSNVYFSQGFGVYVPSEWKQKSIIPCFYKSKKEMQNDIDNKIWIGKKVQILFPIEIEGKKNDYNFEFTVNGTY